MPIAGPNLQLPTSFSDMFEMDAEGNILSVKPAWSSFWAQAGQIMYGDTRSGPTASRPTASLPGRFIGMRFFDTDLGYPVFLASVTSWVRYDGTVV